MVFMYKKWSFNNMSWGNGRFPFLLAVILMCGVLSGCFCSKKSDSESKDSAPDMHTSQISLDWDGDYIGVIPCADCQGIYYHVRISEDGNYHLKRSYLGKSHKILVDQGKFSWTENGNAIQLEEGQVFRVHENALMYADEDGKRIEGDLANHYRLPKVDVGPLSGGPPSELSQSNWEVNRLLQNGGKKWKANFPTLQFEVEGSLRGRAQCNTYFAKYSVPATQRLEVGNISSTKMACPKLDDEQEYMEALNDVSYYFTFDDELMLTNDEFLPLLAARRAVK